MGIQTDVLRGIIGAAVSAISSTYTIQVPGRVFTPPNDGKWIEIVVLQDANRNETWGNEKLFSGDLRFLMHWPIDDSGIYGPIDALNSVADEFPKGREIRFGDARLLIIDNPLILDHDDSGDDLLFPAFVRYQYFHVPA